MRMTRESSSRFKCAMISYCCQEKFAPKGRIIMKCNETVRRAARVKGIPLYAIATEMGISEPTIHRWLRTPLSTEKEREMLSAIERIAEMEGT